MAMQIVIGSDSYQTFTKTMGRRSIFHASGEFSFATSPQNSIILGVTPDNYPLKVQQPCTILIDKNQFISGFSDRIRVLRSVSETSVIISGRDRTMDLIDSTLDGEILTEFTGGISLKQMCEKVISALGILNVNVIDEVTPRKFTKGDLINFQIGESAFSFLSKYADKVNVLLTTDGFGNLVITNGSTDVAAINLTDSTVIDAHLDLDTGNQFNKYKCFSQATAAADLASIDNSQIAGNSNIGTAINDQIRVGRQLVFISDTPLRANEAGDRAIWESNFRQAMGFRYEVRVQGSTYDLDKIKIWRPNLTVNVSDPFIKLNTKLIIQTVEFSESIEGGTTTTLIFVPPNAYQLKLQQDYRESLANQAAFPFSGVQAS